MNSDTAAADRETVWRIHFFVELPFDVGVPTGSTMTLLHATEPTFRGWEHVRWHPGGHTQHVVGLGPLTGVLVRRVKTHRPDPVLAIDDAFGHDHSIAGDSRLRRKWNRLMSPRLYRRFSPPLCTTVARLMRLVSVPDELPENWLSDQFDAGLNALNTFLLSLAASSGDPTIGPVGLRDLPFGVLYELGEAHPDREFAPTSRGLMLLHTRVEIDALPIPSHALGRAQAMAIALHNDLHPFRVFVELWVAAPRALFRGRFAEAVLTAQTAFDVLLSRVIAEGYEAIGTPEKVEGALRSGFKNRLVDHLPKIIGPAAGDLDDPTTPLGEFWASSYSLRNRISKEGHTPTEPESLRALEAIDPVVEAIALGLRADQRTRHLSEYLSIPPDDADTTGSTPGQHKGPNQPETGPVRYRHEPPY